MTLPRAFFFIKHKRLLIAILCLVLTSTASFSSAESRHNRNHAESRKLQEERRPEQARARISASQAAAMVQQRYGGKVMNVNTRQTNGGVIYGVKILQNSGHMRTVNVDGQTGSILN